MNNPALISGNNGSNIIPIGAPQKPQDDTNANVSQLNNANSDFAESMQSAPDLGASEKLEYIQAQQIYGVDAMLLSILFYKDSLFFIKLHTKTEKEKGLKIANPNTIEEYKNCKKDCIKKIINYCFKKTNIHDLEKFSNIIDATLLNEENACLEKDTLKKIAKIPKIKARYESLLYLTVGKENSESNQESIVKIANRQIALAFVEYIVKKSPEWKWCSYSKNINISVYQALLNQAPSLLAKMCLYMHDRPCFTKIASWESSIDSFITLLSVLFKNEKEESFNPDSDTNKSIYDKLFHHLSSFATGMSIFHKMLADNVNIDNGMEISLESKMEIVEPALFGSHQFMIVHGILRILIEEKYYINGDAEFTLDFFETIQQKIEKSCPGITKIIENYQATLLESK